MNKNTPYICVFDVDDTLLGDDEALSALNAVLLTHYPRILLAYNSSRPIASLRKSIAQHTNLVEPDFLIGALGTEIETSAGVKFPNYDEQWHDAGWQREQVLMLLAPFDITYHPIEYQTPYKVSFEIRDSSVPAALRALFNRHEVRARILVTLETKVDVIPVTAGKHMGARYLAKAQRLAESAVIVAGDSENDLDMFISPFKGIVVANAVPQLKQLQSPHIYHASRPYAGGILEGLQYWEVL